MVSKASVIPLKMQRIRFIATLESHAVHREGPLEIPPHAECPASLPVPDGPEPSARPGETAGRLSRSAGSPRVLANFPGTKK